MKKLKKFAALLLVGVMALALLAAVAQPKSRKYWPRSVRRRASR